MGKKVVVNNSGGIGFAGLLGIVFIVLKLTGVITWSWLWVLSPLWIPFAIVCVVGFGALLIWGFAVLLSVIGKKR